MEKLIWKIKDIEQYYEVMRKEYQNIMTQYPLRTGALKRYTDFTSSSEQKEAIQAIEENKTQLKLGDVKYYINDYACRGDWDLTDKTDYLKIAVFGCSFTFGVGIDEDKTWHAIVKQKLKTDKPIQLINLGFPGGSISKALKMFKYLTDIYNIDIAIFLLPTHWREEFVDHKGWSYYNLIPNVAPHHVEQAWETFYNYATEETQLYTALKNVSHIDHIAKTKNIETYFSSWDNPLYELLKQNYLTKKQVLPYFKFIEQFRGMKDSFARDGRHPGPVSQEVFAQEVIEHLNKYSDVRSTKKFPKLI
jgi:hypothetical protein